MVGATYEVHIDFGRDNTFAHALANVTARTTEVEWALGCQNPFDEFAQPARATVTLSNIDRKLTPDNTTSDFYGLFVKGVYVRIRHTYNGTSASWYGKLSKMRVGTGLMANPGGATVTLTFEDEMLKLLKAEYFPELQTNVTTGAVIEDALGSAIVATPYEGTYWVLDASALGTQTKLYDPSQIVGSIDTGYTTLAYVGDNSDRGRGVSLQSFLRDVVIAELGGRFFYNAYTRKFDFHSRYHDVSEYTTNGTSATLASADIDKADLRYGDEVANDITVNYTPRMVGAGGTTLAQIEKTIRLESGQEKTITLRYRDTDVNTEARIAGYDFYTTQSGVDYIANAQADGLGASLTAFLAVTVNAKAQAAEFRLTNTGTSTLYVITLQIRGTPLYSYTQQTVRYVDADSIQRNGVHKDTISLRIVDSEELAQDYARLTCNRFKDPISRLHSVTFVANDSATLMGYARDIRVGDAIQINDTVETKKNEIYTVVGIQHTYGQESGIHRTTWTIKPLARERYWLLGVTGFSELDSTTALAL